MSYIEKSLKEALEEYMLGRPVTVLWTSEDGSLDAMSLSDLLEQEENRFLVDMPDDLTQPAPEEIIQAVHDTQEEPEDCPPRTGTVKEGTGRRNGRSGR